MNVNEMNIKGQINSALVRVSTTIGSAIMGLYYIKYISHSVGKKREIQVKLVYISL